MMCRKFALTSALACLLTAVGLVSCMAQAAAPPTDKTEKKPPVDKSSPPVSHAVSVRVSADKKVYAAGDPIKLTLKARSTSRVDQQFTFYSGQRYDFEIRRGAKPDGPLVWQWSKGMMFTMLVTTETLAPGKTLTYTTTFDPKSSKNSGTAPLAPGIYTVIGTLTVGHPGGRPQSTATFRVK